MNPLNIDFTSSSRFTISVGIVYLFLFFGIIYYFSQKLSGIASNGILIIYAVVLVIFGLGMFISGFNKLRDEEKFLKKYQYELMTSQIVEQDLKFQELRLKNIEANLKAKEYNKKYQDMQYEIAKHREFASIGRQIVNPNFYEDVYGKPKKSRK